MAFHKFTFETEIERREKLAEAQSLLRELSATCVEIGLQTYDRRGSALTETATWQKLQTAEKLTREMGEKARALLAKQEPRP